jgi:pre-rRNA-processing protein TSR4
MAGTDVTLGVPEEPVFLPTEEGVSKIGGTPHWLCGEPSDLSTSRCHSCGSPLALILSADCPINDDHDRILYLFICPRCGKTAKVFRQTRPALSAAPAATVGPLFTAESLTAPTAVSAADILSALKVPPKNAKPQGKPKKQKREREPGRFPAYYIETFEEPEATIDPNLKYEISRGDSDSSEREDEDVPPVKLDGFLVNYNERMSRCPEQVLRYSRGGEPLLQEQIQFEVPPCPICGGARVFELELMPTIIYFVEPESDMDFGPILVYTCSEDCGGESREEFCFVSPP